MTDDVLAFIRARYDEAERAARAWLPLGNPTAVDRDHIARHDPAWVLADLDAKRRILDEHDPYGTGKDPCRRSAGRYCLTVRLLALPFASHPGYRPEWQV